MRRKPVTRFTVVLALVVVLFGLCVWYGTVGPAPDLGAYPGEEQLGADYAQYVGQHATVSGIVTDTSPVTVEAEYGTGEILVVRITGLDITVTKGEVLRVFGVVEPDRTIRAENAFTVPRRGLWYAWTVSFLAGLWVLWRIGRHWRVDFEGWVLVPRADPLERAGRRVRRAVGREKREE